ncbi:hypothetical protein RFI_23703 [Reticulomyxa filosa]|uniref:Uncharacterized protein n=1 Tax=Reticulomyxa filosa TaxID=46433 RepID=X6MIF5_RETFI|nr:hypothetical protein RFI_23703 [Reticulomyxa filosa]|eukprot:ETO13664.1 hypothetical protein RFI_23703 [Reticulomyxa filosa]
MRFFPQKQYRVDSFFMLWLVLLINVAFFVLSFFCLFICLLFFFFLGASALLACVSFLCICGCEELFAKKNCYLLNIFFLFLAQKKNVIHEKKNKNSVYLKILKGQTKQTKKRVLYIILSSIFILQKPRTNKQDKDKDKVKINKNNYRGCISSVSANAFLEELKRTYKYS